MHKLLRQMFTIFNLEVGNYQAAKEITKKLQHSYNLTFIITIPRMVHVASALGLDTCYRSVIFVSTNSYLFYA